MTPTAKTCPTCGKPIFAMLATTGRARFDITPSTDPASQYCWRIGEVDNGGLAEPAADLLDQPSAATLKGRGEALYRTHACGVVPEKTSGRLMPWRPADTTA